MGWVIGALLSVLGSVASNLGVNIQKYSFIRQASRPLAARTSHWRDVYWLSGLGLVIFGSLGDFAALSMVAQSIVAPLASTTLVTNVIFAHFWLHEHVGRRELTGTACIILGSTLAVVFGDHEKRSYTDDDLVHLIGGAWFLVYAILVFVLCMAGLLLHRKITPIKAALVEAIRRYEVAVEASDAQAADWEDEVIARLEMQYKKWIKIHPFALCALSGAFGAQSVLFGKCFAELLSTSLEGRNQMLHFFPWIAAIGMGITVATQLHFLALALNYFDALYVVPVFQCFFIGVSTLGGALYFREVYAMTAGEAFAFVIGLSMTLAGVAVLSTRKMSQRNVVAKIGEEQGSVWHEGASFAGEAPSGGVHRLVPARIPDNEDELADYRDREMMGGGGGGQQQGLLPRGHGHRSSSTSSLGGASVRSSPALSASNPSTNEPGRAFEMSDISARRTQASHTLPTLRDTSRLPGFAERAEEEGRELADVRATVGEAQDALAARLAQAGYGANASSSSSSASSLLTPAASTSSNPALAIQIEADQAYINRRDESGSAGLPTSAQKRRASAASRYDADLDIMTSLDGINQGSPERIAAAAARAAAASGAGGTRSSFHEGAGSAAQGSLEGITIRAETPRSAYVQERERSASFSARNSPTHSGASTPTHAGRKLRDGESPAQGVGGGSSEGGLAVPGSSHHIRGASVQFASPKVGAQLPSAVFSGAFLESAQDLPDLEKDNRLQRLTRLSTVGHWVAGLHAQMPVVGGVAQAILQAKEMQLFLDDQQALEEKEKAAATGGAASAAATPEKKEVELPVAEAVLQPAIELADIKTRPAGGAAEGSGSNSVKASPELKAMSGSAAADASGLVPLPSSSAAAGAFSFSGASSSSSLGPPTSSPVQPTNRVIQFDDSYDPFATSNPTRLTHRDPFAASSSLGDTSFLPSPSSAFASLRPAGAASQNLDPGQLEAERIERASKKVANEDESVVFSPLAVTSKHPLQSSFGLPSPVPSPSPAAAGDAASPQSSASPLSDQPLLGSSPDDDGASPQTPQHQIQPSSHFGADGEPLPVEEWAAALRIQSLYRGASIRRSLRSSRNSVAIPASSQDSADMLSEAEHAALTAVDPALPSVSPIASDDTQASPEINLQ